MADLGGPGDMALDGNIQHWIVFEGTRDAYVSAARRDPEAAADQIMRVEQEREIARDQLRGAVHRGDWFRQAWANANGCTVEEAERAFETLGDITTKRGQ